jgi:hypothetical protein
MDIYKSGGFKSHQDKTQARHTHATGTCILAGIPDNGHPPVFCDMGVMTDMLEISQ